MKTKLAYFLLGGVLVAAVTAGLGSYRGGGELDLAKAQEYMNRSFPNVEVERVMPTSLDRFYAVVAGGKVYYMSGEGDFLMAGALFNLRDDVNLTEQIQALLRKENLANIRDEDLLSYAPEEYRHVVRVFSDVACPYCRKLHGELKELYKRGIRVDYVITPLLGPEAKSKAVSVWCSEDRHAAMDAGMSGAPVGDKTCEGHPIDGNMELARSLGVRATPSFLLEDGRLLIGYRPAVDLLYEIKNPPKDSG